MSLFIALCSFLSSHSRNLLQDSFLVRRHLLLHVLQDSLQLDVLLLQDGQLRLLLRQLPLPLCPTGLARPVVLLPHPPVLLLLCQLLHLDPAPLCLLCLLLHLHLLDKEACSGLLHLVGEGKVGNLGVVHDPLKQVVCLAWFHIASVVVIVCNVDRQLNSSFGFNCWQAEPKVGIFKADSGPDCLCVVVGEHIHLRLLLGDVQGGGGEGLGQCEVKRGVLNHLHYVCGVLWQRNSILLNRQVLDLFFNHIHRRCAGAVTDRLPEEEVIKVDCVDHCYVVGVLFHVVGSVKDPGELLSGGKFLLHLLGGGDFEALHTPNWGVEAGLLSLHYHGLLRWLLQA